MVTTLSLGYIPIAATVDATRRVTWVAAQGGGGNDPVWAINADTFGVISGPIGTGGVVGNQLVVNPVTGRLYLNSSGFKEVDPNTFVVSSETFGSVQGVNPVTDRLYALSDATTLKIVNGTSEAVLSIISLPYSKVGSFIGVDTSLNRLYLAGNDGVLHVLDGTTGAELNTFSLGANFNTYDVTVDSTRHRIYVSGFSNGADPLQWRQPVCIAGRTGAVSVGIGGHGVGVAGCPLCRAP